MAAREESPMPDLPLGQTIYLGGAAIAFGLFIVTLFIVQFTAGDKR
jgi:hypothetical protein